MGLGLSTCVWCLTVLLRRWLRSDVVPSRVPALHAVRVSERAIQLLNLSHHLSRRTEYSGSPPYGPDRQCTTVRRASSSKPEPSW